MINLTRQNSAMKIFFDTEFTCLGLDPKLISIGFVSEDGARTFYAELSDSYRLDQCSDFVHEEVLPRLEGGDSLMTTSELTLRLGNWIESFECPVTLVTDAVAWDWPFILELFSLPGTWPENLHRKAELLRDDDGFNECVDLVYDKQPQLIRHHALDDARANQLARLLICAARI